MIYLNFENRKVILFQMNKLVGFVFVLLLVISGKAAFIYYSGVPVNQLLLLKVELALNFFEKQLDSKFNTILQNDQVILVKSLITEYYLKEMSKQLSRYNNIVIGQNNTISGKATSNMIIGSNNKINGSTASSYIFSSNLNMNTTAKAMESTLVLNQYVVEFLNSHMDPKLYKAKDSISVVTK